MKKMSDYSNLLKPNEGESTTAAIIRHLNEKNSLRFAHYYTAALLRSIEEEEDLDEIRKIVFTGISWLKRNIGAYCPSKDERDEFWEQAELYRMLDREYAMGVYHAVRVKKGGTVFKEGEWYSDSNGKDYKVIYLNEGDLRCKRVDTAYRERMTERGFDPETRPTILSNPKEMAEESPDA